MLLKSKLILIKLFFAKNKLFKMIVGVGVDIVSITRIEDIILRFNEKFEAKIFTPNEIETAKKKLKNLQTIFYAKRFAAKEAFAKALGMGIGRGIDFCDIEISNDNLGKPQIRLLHGKEEFLKQHFNCKNFAIHLSLSDENPNAIAFVTIEIF